MQDSIEPIIFEAKFPHISIELIDLLKTLLTFSPDMRPTAKDCLKNPIFDSLRVKTLEESADFKLKLELDEMDLFDYEECVDNLTIEKCHEILQQEIALFKEIKGGSSKPE